MTDMLLSIYGRFATLIVLPWTFRPSHGPRTNIQSWSFRHLPVYFAVPCVKLQLHQNCTSLKLKPKHGVIDRAHARSILPHSGYLPCARAHGPFSNTMRLTSDQTMFLMS